MQRERGSSSLPGSFLQLKIAAVLLLCLTVISIIGLLIFDVRQTYENPLLITTLNFVFITVVSFIIAGFSARSFLITGAHYLIWIGASSALFGLTLLVSPYLLVPFGANIAVTVHNSGVLVAGVCQVISAILAFRPRIPGKSLQAGLAVIAAVYMAVVLFVSLLVLSAVRGVIPPFIIAGQGFTLLRQGILITSTLLFTAAAIIYAIIYFRVRADFGFWYSLGLGAITIGLAAVLVQPGVGSAIGWTGRGAQQLSGIYFALSIISLVRAARTEKIDFTRVLADIFREIPKTYWNLVESAHDAIIVTDSNFVIRAWNQGAERMYMRNAKEVIGKNTAEVFQTKYAAPLNPEDIMQKLQTEGFWSGEVTQKRKDGTSIYVFTSMTALTDKAGNLIGTAAFQRDTTKNRLLEEEAGIARKAGDPLIVIDMDLKATYWNKAAEYLYGWSADEILGKAVYDFLHGEFPLPRKEMEKYVLEHGCWTGEVINTRKDGSKAIVLHTDTALKDSAGNITGWLASHHDITELKKAEKLKEEFIGMVSHELKTPLTVMMGALYTLKDENNISEEDRRQLLQDSIHSSESLASIVENLLELSRSQAKRLLLSSQTVDIGEIAQSVVQKLKKISERHRLKIELPAEIPTIQADPVRVERILYNLVENAIKYSPKGGEVRIFARPEEGCLTVGISDEGPGISSEDQKKLFQSFEQLGMTTRNAMQGVGLGLKVCRTLAEAHNGQIWVESEPGKGSTFFFTLPRVSKTI